MAVVHIEITNACNLQCANCTRFVGHHRKPFFMDLPMVRKALASLEGFPGQIGIMGGEPTIHPKFAEICMIVQKLVPNQNQRSLWTNGFKWKEYHKIINQTFDKKNILYNDHKDLNVGKHQPLLAAATDLLKDKELMWRLIGNCWVQWRWAASITPKGAFFCEVAAAQDHLFNGPGGWPITKGWWKRNPNELFDQVKRYCPNCSAAIPLPATDAHATYDVISKSNAKRLKRAMSPKYLQGRYKLLDKKYTEADVQKVIDKGWTPWSHRPYKQTSPNKKWTENTL